MSVPSVPSSDPSVWDGVAVLWRHKWKMAICFVTVFFFAILASILSSKTYRSEAKLLVRLGRENVGLDPTAMAGDLGTVNVMQSREEEINSVATLLANRSLAEQVVDRIGVDRILNQNVSSTEEATDVAVVATQPSLFAGVVGQIIPSSQLNPRDKAIRRLQQRLDIQAISDTSLVQISYESHDPELSRQVVSELVNLYLANHVHLHRTPGSHQFFAEQTKQIQQELLAAEEELRVTKRETGLVAPTEQRAALVLQIASLQSKHIDLQGQIAELEVATQQTREKLAGLSKTMIAEETSGAANFASDAMREQLYALQLRHQELLSTHTFSHPSVKQIEMQIKAAQDILNAEANDRTEVTLAPNRVYEAIELDQLRKELILESVRAKDELVKQQLADAEADLHELNDNETKIARLQRQVDIQDSKYRKYAADTEQARIDSSLEEAQMSNISLAQPATLDWYPASPNVKLNLLLGLIASISSSCGLALVCESRQHWKRRRQVA